MVGKQKWNRNHAARKNEEKWKHKIFGKKNVIENIPNLNRYRQQKECNRIDKKLILGQTYVKDTWTE